MRWYEVGSTKPELAHELAHTNLAAALQEKKCLVALLGELHLFVEEQALDLSLLRSSREFCSRCFDMSSVCNKGGVVCNLTMLEVESEGFPCRSLLSLGALGEGSG